MTFFGTSQWNRFFGDAGASQLVVPTAAGFDVLNNLATAGNANAKLMVDALGSVRSTNPQGTVAIGNRAGCIGCEVEYGYFRRTDSGKTLSREWTGRVDYNSSNDNIYVRYTDSRNDSSPDLFANGGALPSPRTTEIPQRGKSPSFPLCKRGMKGGFVCACVSIAATRAVTGSGSRATMLALIPRCCAQLVIRAGMSPLPVPTSRREKRLSFPLPTSRSKPDSTLRQPPR